MIIISLEEAENYVEGDRCATIDTSEHDKQIREKAIEEFVNEWVSAHDKVIRADEREKTITEYYEKLTRNFMRMIATHTIGEILDKTHEQMIKEQSE